MKHCIYFLTVFTSVLLSTATIAQDTYMCLFDGNERTIRVAYAYPDSRVPCDVVYEKDTGSQILWRAQSEEGFCESQALSFVEKQRGWGWDCAKMDSPEGIQPMATPAVSTSTATTPAE